jgi:hypothetical protein
MFDVWSEFMLSIVGEDFIYISLPASSLDYYLYISR